MRKIESAQRQVKRRCRPLRKRTVDFIKRTAKRAGIPPVVELIVKNQRFWRVTCPLCGKVTRLPHDTILRRKGRFERSSSERKIDFQSLFVCGNDAREIGAIKQKLGSNAYLYKKSNNRKLCELLQWHFDNRSINNFSDLLHVDAPLYLELSRRGCWKAVVTQYGHHVRRDIDYSAKSDTWWKRHSRLFDSLSHWKNVSSHSMKMARELGKLPILKEYNKARWAKWVGFDQKTYQSRPEMVVANFLYVHGIKYTAHVALPFKEPKGTMTADFYLHDFDIYIEVFQQSCESMEMYPDDANVRRYYERRVLKEKLYSKYKLKLVAVEASLYKFGKLLDYAEHVGDRLSIHGVKVASENLRNPELEISVVCKYLAMSAKNIAEFIVHDLNGSGMRDLGKYSQPMASFVRQKNDGRFIIQVVKWISALTGKQVNTRYIKVEDKIIEKYIKLHDLTRVQYDKLYMGNKLPDGFPRRPQLSFPVARGEVPGKKPKTYADAKSHLASVCTKRNIQLLSERDFLEAREKYPELRSIPKQPDNPTAYGKKFQSWADFLGGNVRRKKK